jgi:hypothetical protein
MVLEFADMGDYQGSPGGDGDKYGWHELEETYDSGLPKVLSKDPNRSAWLHQFPCLLGKFDLR